MGNLSSNNKYLFDKFVLYQPNFDFYINLINSLITENIELKKNAINQIEEIKIAFNLNWSKYTWDNFKIIDDNTIEYITDIRKNMTHDYVHKCSKIYDNVINKLNMKYEEDTTVYKT
jgi:hypothetical protein